MKKINILIALTIVMTSMIWLLGFTPTAQASSPMDCRGGTTYTDGTGRIHCITALDQATAVKTGKLAAPSANDSAPITGNPNPVICDGDGSTGYRFQVVYAYVTGNTNQYNTYRTSFQEWAHEVDLAMVTSAAATGGVRHIRFVHDANCFPVIAQAALSSAAASSFSQTITELSALGYNRTDRDYMIFFDANTYCGVSTVLTDDSAGQTNWNNSGPNYGRIDGGCWDIPNVAPPIAIHETAHVLGAVQPSAPHASAQNFHADDGHDVMADYGSPHDASFTDNACPDSSFNYLYDCNHDDYLNTNPPAGSYLATHWNIARNQFLIYSNQTAVRVDSIVTGKLSGSVFTATDSFKPGDSVVVRVHMADTNGVNVSGASVSFVVNQPSGSTQCTFTNQTTDSTGTAQATCAIPQSASIGSWTAKLSSFTRSSTSSDNTDSVTQHAFAVQSPTAVTLSSFTAQSTSPVAENSNTPNILVPVFLGILATLGARKLFVQR